MEEEARHRPSVAELAGRFKGSAAAPDAAGQEIGKPVRRRPPQSLKLPKTSADDKEPSGVTSPLPAKAKRNSALIEKLQANLALSPNALLASPKSPGFRLIHPSFPLPSAGSSPVTPVTPVTPVSPSSTSTPTSSLPALPLTEAESPSSFEAPPSVSEGAILSNDSIKGRARHSIRRRPPSRRNRKSSSEEDIGLAGGGGAKDERGEDLPQEARKGEVTEKETVAEEIYPKDEDQPQASTTLSEESKGKEERVDQTTKTEEKEGTTSGVEKLEESTSRAVEKEGSPSRPLKEEGSPSKAEEEVTTEQQEVMTEGKTPSESKEEQEKTEATNDHNQVSEQQPR